MKIKTIASSSAGCCYVIESAGEQLIIDCGVSLKTIRRELDFDLSRVVGCLISHEHGDHAKYSKEIERAGIPIYCTNGTEKRFDLKLCNVLNHNNFFNCGVVWSINPLELVHNVQCFGFAITSGIDKIFYATDTGSIKYQIPELDYVMIEANHSFELLIDSGLDRSYVSSASENHLSIDRVVNFCRNHKDLKEIHLIHLSGAHSDEADFKKRVAAVAGCPVYVSKK